MSLSASLRALGESLAPAEQEWGDPELPAALLCPRLRTTYSPRTSWFVHRGFGQEEADRRPAWSRVWERGNPDPVGLSLAPNSKRPPRYGLEGFPAPARRNVWRALALLEERRPLLSFWTISLPSEALDQLAASDRWPVFQDRIRKELIRQLELRSLPPMVVAVVELQPKRSRLEGRPCPHLHVVFQGKARPRPGGWALSPGDLDALIAVALASAGVVAPEGQSDVAWLASAGNVQGIRKSVRAYLSCYLTKKQCRTDPWVGTVWEPLLPRQWWFWSRPMRALVLAHCFRIAFPFLLWVHRFRKELTDRDMIRHRLIDLPDPRAPLVWEVDWIDCDALAVLVMAWQEDQWDAEWHRSQCLPQCQY